MNKIRTSQDNGFVIALKFLIFMTLVYTAISVLIPVLDTVWNTFLHRDPRPLLFTGLALVLIFVFGSKGQRDGDGTEEHF